MGELSLHADDIHYTGARFTDSAADTAAAFERHHSDLEQLTGDLFGATRAAITGKVAGWRTRIADLTDRLDQHGADLHTSASTFVNTDETVSSAITVVDGALRGLDL